MAATLFSALPGLGSATAAVLFDPGAVDCPETGAETKAIDANANAADDLMNVRCIDTLDLHPDAIQR